jgi:solute carrier family 25 citrate transporter 1
MQLYPEMNKKGTVNVVKETFASKGPFGKDIINLGFYRGYTALLFFSVPKNYVRFGTNAWVKTNVFKGKDTKVNTTIAGLCAGAMEALIVVTPQETLKTKLIHDKLSEHPKYKGLFHGIYTIFKEHGASGVYKGALPTVLKQSTNQGTRFLVYGETRKFLDNYFNSTTFKDFLSGCFAGICSVFVNNPIDVVKTQMQGLQAQQYNGTLDCFSQILKNEGVAGFYKGVTPRLLRVSLDVALTFTIFAKMNDIVIQKYLNYRGIKE